MIFLFGLFSSNNPKKVLLGHWRGDNFELTISKVEKNKFWGICKRKNKIEKIEGDYKESIWDQPCSKAYDVKFHLSGKIIKIKFIGYEKQSEINDCLICEGNLQGIEALIESGKEMKILYKK
jgi:hypothetical protein